MTDEAKGALVLSIKDLSEVRDGENLQQIFEALLRRFVANGGKKEVVFNFGSLPIGSISFEQQFFVRPSYPGNLPDMGLALVAEEKGRAEYCAGFFISSPRTYGKILVGEFNFTFRREGRGLSAPLYYFSAAELPDRYDAPIVQAAVNVYGKPILNSKTVRIDEEERRKKLEEDGYRPRPGYPEVFDKIYQPSS